MVQFFAALIMLLIGTYSDLRTRTVSNNVWISGGLVGSILSILEYGAYPATLFSWFAISGVVAIGSYVVWRFASKYIGGADVKCFMALGLLLSPFAFMVIAAGLVFGAVYGLGLVTVRGKSFEDLRKVKVPLVPFVLVGLVFAWIYALAV